MAPKTTPRRRHPKLKHALSPHLHFLLYTVRGKAGRRRLTFRIVCCHAADARAMIVERYPKIDALTVTRGEPVHFIAIGDHLLHE